MGLDTVEMIVLVEDTFGIQIKDEDAENIATVGQLIDHVHGKLKDRPSYRKRRDLVKEIVIRIISEISGIPVRDIKPWHSFTRDLGMD